MVKVTTPSLVIATLGVITYSLLVSSKSMELSRVMKVVTLKNNESLQSEAIARMTY